MFGVDIAYWIAAGTGLLAILTVIVKLTPNTTDDTVLEKIKSMWASITTKKDNKDE